MITWHEYIKPERIRTASAWEKGELVKEGFEIIKSPEQTNNRDWILYKPGQVYVEVWQEGNNSTVLLLVKTRDIVNLFPGRKQISEKLIQKFIEEVNEDKILLLINYGGTAYVKRRA